MTWDSFFEGLGIVLLAGLLLAAAGETAIWIILLAAALNAAQSG